MSMFEVVIQLGAIMAVVVMFFRKLNPFALSKSKEEKRGTWTLWFKIAVASIPAALIGIVGDKLLEKATGRDIDGWIYNWAVVAAALIFYGVLFIVVEKWQTKKAVRVERTEDISYKDALLMGGFQALSIIPGTSRSGSTILGARTMGISRSAAAEFSFFMGIPAMAGGSLIKALGFLDYVAESGVKVPALAWAVLIVASVSAFIVSLFVIRFLMDFVRKHSFAPFGVYRIILGIAVTVYFLIR